MTVETVKPFNPGAKMPELGIDDLLKMIGELHVASRVKDAQIAQLSAQVKALTPKPKRPKAPPVE